VRDRTGSGGKGSRTVAGPLSHRARGKLLVVFSAAMAETKRVPWSCPERGPEPTWPIPAHVATCGTQSTDQYQSQTVHRSAVLTQLLNRYNTRRRHSRLGQRSAIAYETALATTATTLAQAA
jgi:hypothetical protein